MNVLVTGADGFVGRALVARLAGEPSFTVLAASRRRPEALPAGVEWREAPDLAAEEPWERVVRGAEGVVHLAARVHVMRDHAGDLLAVYRAVNVAGTMRVARAAAAAGATRFVYVSSVKVNGEATPPGRPFTEADPPSPSDPYGVSKAEAESALLAFARESGMAVSIVRPPLVYGPGVKANFLAMARWLRRGIPLPLGAIRGNRRSLVALDNLVDLIMTCLVHPGARNEIFLAGDGEDLSTTDLLTRTAVALGVHPRLIPVPAALLALGASLVRRPEIWQRLGGSLQVDISKARQRLGWQPPVTVDEGLRRAVVDLRPGAR